MKAMIIFLVFVMQSAAQLLFAQNLTIEVCDIEKVEGHLYVAIYNSEETFMKNNISFRIIGDLTKLPDNVRERLETCIAHTANNTGMSLVLAISYSSRWEITEAARRLAALVQKGELTPEQIDSTLLSQYLATDFMPDPDLLIRTGGEIRLSNYLLWQCAYSELYFCDTYWPDFREEALHKAIYDYQKRERRFGKTSEQIS